MASFAAIAALVRRVNVHFARSETSKSCKHEQNKAQQPLTICIIAVFTNLL